MLPAIRLFSTNLSPLARCPFTTCLIIVYLTSMPPITTSASEQALVTALRWLNRRTGTQLQVATDYMTWHAVILRWTTALLALVELLDQQVMMGFCIFDVSAVMAATGEVISATISLPDQIFCPLYFGQPCDYTMMCNWPMESSKKSLLRSLGTCALQLWEFGPLVHPKQDTHRC